MNTNKTLGSNKQHSDRECLYKAEVTMTGKGVRLQEWIPVFSTVNVRDSTRLSQVALNAIHNPVCRLQVYVQIAYSANR